MRYKAVFFDCDGVLVDSEPIGLQVLRQMLAKRGWLLSPLACKDLFLGRAVDDWPEIISKHGPFAVEAEWLAAYRLKRNQALKQQIKAVPGIGEALQRVAQYWPHKMACVSAARYEKIMLQLQYLKLTHYFTPYIFSGTDVARNKPYPDVYRAACQRFNLAGIDCAVIEDSLTGIRAAAQAGTVVYAYTNYIHPAEALAEGAQYTFDAMHQLPNLLINA